MLEIIEQFNDLIQDKLADGKRVNAKAIGLDARAGNVWIFEDCIVTDQPRVLDYYGGFEYVDNRYVTVLGDYKIYSAEDSRVQDSLDFFKESSDEKVD